MIVVFIAPLLIFSGLIMGVPPGIVLGYLVRKLRGRSLGVGRAIGYAFLGWLASAFLDCVFVGVLSSEQAGAISDETYRLVGATLAAVAVTLGLSGGQRREAELSRT